jgi:hypothetical protein
LQFGFFVSQLYDNDKVEDAAVCTDIQSSVGVAVCGCADVGPACGNGICFQESCETCPQDCGACIHTCTVLSMTNPTDGDLFTFLALKGSTVACEMTGVDGDVDMTIEWEEGFCKPFSLDSNEFCITSTLASDENVTLSINDYQPDSNITISCIMSPCPETTICGNGICFLESCETCPQDSGTCIHTCNVLSTTDPDRR